MLGVTLCSSWEWILPDDEVRTSKRVAWLTSSIWWLIKWNLDIGLFLHQLPEESRKVIRKKAILLKKVITTNSYAIVFNQTTKVPIIEFSPSASKYFIWIEDHSWIPDPWGTGKSDIFWQIDDNSRMKESNMAIGHSFTILWTSYHTTLYLPGLGTTGKEP